MKQPSGFWWNSSNKRVWRVVLLVATLIAFYGCLILLLKALDIDTVRRWIAQAGWWSPLLFTIISSLSLIVAPFNASSTFILGGLFFGKEMGFGLSFLASLLGCSTNFWISRYFGRQVALRLLGKNSLASLDKFVYRLNHRHGIFYMMLIMPIAQDIVSYAVGLTNIRYLNFFIALFVSGLVVVTAYVYFGTSLLEILI
jgi:uncharacterized membrane protein YdjX (TVP38/TMEM64 family)